MLRLFLLCLKDQIIFSRRLLSPLPSIQFSGFPPHIFPDGKTGWGIKLGLIPWQVNWTDTDSTVLLRQRGHKKQRIPQAQRINYCSSCSYHARLLFFIIYIEQIIDMVELKYIIPLCGQLQSQR